MPNPIHSERYTVFRQMLTSARQQKGLLQADVAERLGKNQSFVSKYERGERRLDFPEFLEIADVLELNVIDFIETYKTQVSATRDGFKRRKK